MEMVSNEPQASMTPRPTVIDSEARALFQLFAVMWAIASLFHVLGPSGRVIGFLNTPTWPGVCHVLLACAALWLLARSGDTTPLLVVAILGPLTAWQESPFLGSHWLVAALVDLALIFAAAVARRGWRTDRDLMATTFLPLARSTLLIFYAFAACAKLNSAFLDARVSCASFYFDEIARSLHLSTPVAVGGSSWTQLVPFGSVSVELLIPLLLAVRRARTLAVLLGLVFHSVIALDTIHLFIDFSSVLLALFVVFLPSTLAVSTLRAAARPFGQVTCRIWMAVCALVTYSALNGSGPLTAFVFFDGRLLLWYSVDAVAVGTLIVWMLGRHSDGETSHCRSFWKLTPRWLSIVPLFVIANGLLPYLELRTAFGFTMYSNLVMIDGRSNHLAIRSSFPVGSRHRDLVRIVSSDDGGLELYSSRGYDLPWDSFRTYMSMRPNAKVHFIRGGVDFDLERASDDPAVVSPPPLVVQKLFPLRAVDQQEPPRCQDRFLPAL
jgi:hypothetical protein